MIKIINKIIIANTIAAYFAYCLILSITSDGHTPVALHPKSFKLLANSSVITRANSPAASPKLFPVDAA